jgi:hypothetical protein
MLMVGRLSLLSRTCCLWLAMLLATTVSSGCTAAAAWERDLYENMPEAVYDPETGERISPGVI